MSRKWECFFVILIVSYSTVNKNWYENMYSLADFRIQTTSYFSIALTFVCIMMEMWGIWTTFLCFCLPSIFCTGTALRQFNDSVDNFYIFWWFRHKVHYKFISYVAYMYLWIVELWKLCSYCIIEINTMPYMLNYKI